MKVVLGVSIPLSDKGGFVEVDWKGEDADTAEGVYDGQLRRRRGGPGQMDYGPPLKRSRENGTCYGLVQLPRAVFGIGTGTLKVDVGAVWRDRRHDAMLGVCDSS